MRESPGVPPTVLAALTQVITGGSGSQPENAQTVGRYRKASELQVLFASCGIDFAVGGLSRLPAVRDKLQEVASGGSGVQSLTCLIERSIDPREFESYSDPRLEAAVELLNKVLRPENLKVELQDGLYEVFEISGASASLQAAGEIAIEFRLDALKRELDRIQANISTDPEDALTAANSALESVCRDILLDLGAKLPAKQDISTLYKDASEHLKISPAGREYDPRIVADVKRVLGGLNNVVTGVGALRTHAGDAHGKDSVAVRIDSRIARLAAHASCTAAIFMIETWQRNHGRDA